MADYPSILPLPVFLNIDGLRSFLTLSPGDVSIRLKLLTNDKEGSSLIFTPLNLLMGVALLR